MPKQPSPKKEKKERRTVLDDTLLMNTVTRYFKLAGVVFGIWLFGYQRFSVSWLLLLLVVYVWKERHTKARHHRMTIGRELAVNEKAVILARVEDLPSWVNFPDVERAEWLNKMLDQMWPYIGEYVEKILRESVEPSIKSSLPDSLKSFRFNKIDVGDIPPRIGGIKVYTQLKRDEIYMDMEINYNSDADISVNVKGVNAGIKDLTLHGTLRIIFKPLINKSPLIGGMQVFFLNNPDLDFNLTGLTNAFDLPGLSDMLHSIIQEQIANFMVLPNRLPIKLADGLDLNKLRYPLPQGVVRINVLEAKDLIKADIGLTGKGKSDPYVVVRVGAQSMKTKVINNSLHPRWDETFELIVDSADGQLIYIDVFDEDPGNKDDDLGRVNMELSTLREVGIEDQWLQLEDVKHGLIHIQMTWLWLAKDPLELDRIFAQRREETQKTLKTSKHHFKKKVGKVISKVNEANTDSEKTHAALLMVYLDSAYNLPRGKKSLNEPSPQMTLSIGQISKQSAIKPNTNEPRWEESYRFMVRNPNYQNLDIELTDTKSKKTIGGTAIKLKDLLVAEDMVMDQKFHIKTSEPDSYILMRLCLRILTPTSNPEWIEDDEELIDEEEANRLEKERKAEAAAGSSVDGSKPVAEKPITPAQSSETEGAELIQRTGPSVNAAGVFGLGRIQMTFRYSPQREKLIIVIHKCCNLAPVEGDSKNLADPYVKLYLLPEKSSSSKRKTEVIKDNLNPVFDKNVEYAVRQHELPERTLEVTVKNETGVFSSTKTMMGMVLIDMGSLDVSKAVTQWFDLAPEDTVKTTSFESEI